MRSKTREGGVPAGQGGSTGQAKVESMKMTTSMLTLCMTLMVIVRTGRGFCQVDAAIAPSASSLAFVVPSGLRRHGCLAPETKSRNCVGPRDGSWTTSFRVASASPRSRRSATSLHLIRGMLDRLRGNKKDDKTEKDDDDEEEEDSATLKPAQVKGEESTPNVASSTATPKSTAAASKLSLEEEAEALRAAAVRTRLEAERMDAELTLSKIEKLEKQLKATTNKSSPANATTANDLKDQLTDLQRRLGLLTKPDTDSAAAKTTLPTNTTTATSPPSPPPPSLSLTATDADKSTTASDGTTASLSSSSSPSSSRPPLTEADIQKRIEEFDAQTALYKFGVARAAGYFVNSPDDVEKVNRTDLILRLYEIEAQDFYGADGRLSAEEEDAMEVTAKTVSSLLPEGLRNQYFGSKDANGTAFVDNMQQLIKIKQAFDRNTGYEEGTSQVIQSLFPRHVWNRAEADRPPTVDEAKELVQQLSSRNLFCRPLAEPRAVNGGFLLGGTNTFDNGTALMNAIDEAQLPLLQDRLSLTFLFDPADFSMPDDFDEENAMPTMPLDFQRSTVLFVMAKEATTTPRRRVLKTLTSIVGVVAAWIASVGPFLNNPVLLKRAEDELTLLDSGLEGDLTWLTELAVPLFATYMIIQACHELAHRLVATYYKMDITIPTFVPSPLTGLTTSVTSFKSSPPNKQALLDFALAGPLAGMLASFVAMVVGLQWTAEAGAAGSQVLDALPILSFDLLRQSSLAGATVNSFLGPGTLDVPAMDAAASRALTLHIHPVAVAGFLGLFTHALSLLPLGCTDGGRVSTAIFGRSGHSFVNTVTMSAVILTGFFGSDLFLYYGIFAAFFQGESEIPLQDETDDVSPTRLALVLGSTLLVVISLLPM